MFILGLTAILSALNAAPPPPCQGEGIAPLRECRHETDSAFKPGRGDFRRLEREKLRELEKEDPERFQRLCAMKNKNPGGFRREIRKQLREDFEKSPEHQVFMKLVESARQGDENAEAQLLETVSKEFDARLAESEKFFHAEKERLDKQRKRLDKLKQDREKSISRILKNILSGHPPPPPPEEP